MSARDRMFLRNYAGTLYKGDIPILKFDIQNKVLKSFIIFNQKLLQEPLKSWGVSYFFINEYFKSRVVMEGAQWCDEYIHGLGLPYYDFEMLVKVNKGRNNIDEYHVVESNNMPKFIPI